MTDSDKNLSHIGVFKKIAHRLYKEFLEKSITHGIRMISRTQGDSYGRYIWLGFMAFILVLTHLDVYELAVAFVESPTETRLSPKVVHVKNVVFPAVAICNNNQISKKALDDFASELYQFQQLYYPNLSARTADELANQLLAFGGFLLYPFDAYTSYSQQLQNLHDLLALKYGNGTYPTRAILRQLAPKCEDLMVRCIIAGKTLNCSDIFFLRTTTSGVCCIYGYRRISADVDGKELFEHSKNSTSKGNSHFISSGVRNSLQVILQDNISDYTLKEYPCNGFRTLLFYPDDYPDIETGSVTKALVGYDEEYEIAIQPNILEGSPRMKQFSTKMRHCLFLEEGREILKQHYYSFSECMLHCRTLSLVNHCGCMVPVLPAYITDASYCQLLDLPCINLWKGVWWQWSSFDYVSENQQAKSVLELCKSCLPRCNLLSYRILVNARPLNIPRNESQFKAGILVNLTTSKPTTVLKFFYKSAFSQVKTHDISGDWIELLARYGGICSIMYGFSIVGLIEMMYFVSGKWFVVWWRAIVECYTNRRRRKAEEANQQELYWDELKPKAVRRGLGELL